MTDYATQHARYAAAGQEHVFRFWPQLNEAQRASLLAELAEVDPAEATSLAQQLVLAGVGAAGVDLTDLSPAPYVALPERGGDLARWQEARAAGEEALAAGRVAAFVVAGGQGTRLGYDGPKGTFPVTPVRRRTLFQVFADKLRYASKRYGRPIPWFVMTSHANHAATVAYFRENGWLGLEPGLVHFFTQGRMPAVDFQGKILLETPSSLALSPDGHGGSLRALVRSGATSRMAAAGIDLLSYFQVDNPLVQAIDPAFLGFHLLAGAEMSSKMLEKAYPKEKLGHFCQQRGRQVVIEYSDMPDSLTSLRDPAGQLLYRAGSIAIHVLNRGFVESLGGADSRLPFHRADKKIATVDAAGQPAKPSAPNGVKFEMFVFDALPFAQNPVIIETRREDEFSPVKNAEGLDSPATCTRDQLRQFGRWAKGAGLEVPTDAEGTPAITFEVSPRLAVDSLSFAEAVAALPQPPVLAPGTVLE